MLSWDQSEFLHSTHTYRNKLKQRMHFLMFNYDYYGHFACGMWHDVIFLHVAAFIKFLRSLPFFHFQLYFQVFDTKICNLIFSCRFSSTFVDELAKLQQYQYICVCVCVWECAPTMFWAIVELCAEGMCACGVNHWLVRVSVYVCSAK